MLGYALVQIIYLFIHRKLLTFLQKKKIPFFFPSSIYKRPQRSNIKDIFLGQQPLITHNDSVTTKVI